LHPDKGKLAVKRGRKAVSLIGGVSSTEIVWLPKAIEEKPDRISLALFKRDVFLR
jgi:hypothetical protein